MERYVVLRATLERLFREIPLRKYFVFKGFRAVETVIIDLDFESVMCGDDPKNNECIAYGTISNNRSFYCDDVEEDHHDIYPLTVMLIRAVGVPVESYYMTQLWRFIVTSQTNRHPLFEKQLLRVIVGFL